MDNKEYYYNASYVTIWGEVKDQPDMVIVTDGSDYGDGLVVTRRDNLVPKEESYQYKQAQKKADELKAITSQAEADLEAVIEKVIEKSIKSLSTRIKLNAIFGDSSNAGWAVEISNELEKLIKEKAPEIVKERKYSS